jgi:hypothetical protein
MNSRIELIISGHLKIISRPTRDSSRSSCNGAGVGICHAPAPVVLIHVFFIFFFVPFIVSNIFVILVPILFSAWRLWLNIESETHLRRRLMSDGRCCFFGADSQGLMNLFETEMRGDLHQVLEP